MLTPFQVVKDFEKEVAHYTGAPYCVAVNSCSNAIFLCLKWVYHRNAMDWVEIPKRTYISVPMQIKHAGFDHVKFRDEEWRGIYQLTPFPIYDSARRFTSNMFFDLHTMKHSSFSEMYMCTSHHWNKTLGIQQGGCILHNNPLADTWFRRARFDGRAEGVPPSQDAFPMLGWHMYMSPEIAAAGLVRLAQLPANNPDMPNDNYPDLSKLDLFRKG